MAILVFSISFILGGWWLGRFITGSGYNNDSSSHGQDAFTSGETTSSAYDHHGD